MQSVSRITPRILSATDFSEESERAFYHALALAVAQQARLTLLHIGPESRKEVPWGNYPGVRNTLVSWGMLEGDAPREDVSERIGLNVKKMAMRDEDPYNGMVDYLRMHPTDLLVMATAGRRGLARLSRASVAEGVAFTTHSHALLLPNGANGLIDGSTGKRTLHKALFVCDHEPDPRSALPWLAEWLPVLGDGDIEVHLLYVGEERDAPEIALPEHPQLEWKRVARKGRSADIVLEYADEFDPQLLIMMNQRRRTMLRRLRGSVSSQVLRRAHRPTLLMPELSPQTNPTAPR